jgi:hypothetical protein
MPRNDLPQAEYDKERYGDADEGVSGGIGEIRIAAEAWAICAGHFTHDGLIVPDQLRDDMLDLDTAR